MATRAQALRGFTLVEVMIVVALIGILSAIAIPNYRGFQLRSKNAEVKGNLGAIRTAEMSFFAEFGAYVAASQTPPAIPGQARSDFAPVGAGFGELGFSPAGRVYFSYAVGVSADRSGFTAEAAADIDSDAVVQYWAYPRPASDGSFVVPPIGCAVASLVRDSLGACDPKFGQSVF